jgi:16S rRNA (adenine1518-N6/adenine1519-N6)-dimethyltransferase
MKLSVMKQILTGRGIQLTKSLGQSFLHDANQLRRIVEAAELTKADRVLEIGPGLGPLTELLVERAGEVLAIEKDARLVEVLRERLRLDAGGRPGLRLVHDDALKFLRREGRDWGDWKLVANLPYSVASLLLVALAQARRGPRRMVVTLQLAVAKRVLAQAGDQDYGVLTLLVQLDYEPRGWFKIPAGCFFPEPAVDSACVSLARRREPLLAPGQAEVFARIVKRSFSQRRKMMRKLLEADWPPAKVERAFARLYPRPLPAQARAETATLEQFVRLTQLLSLESGYG